MGARRCLGRRREDRRGKLRCLAKTGRQRNPADRAGALVILPAGAGDVSPHHGFDRQRRETLNHERSARDLRVFRGRDDRLRVDPCQVVRDHMPEPREPERRQRGQHPTLAGNRRRQDYVECGQPVGLNHEQLVLTHRIEVPHLATVDQRQTFEARLEQRCAGQVHHLDHDRRGLSACITSPPSSADSRGPTCRPQ